MKYFTGKYNINYNMINYNMINYSSFRSIKVHKLYNVRMDN